MQASVVTFSVQVASDGFSIARAVAEKLGFHYYDWAITSRTMSALASHPLSGKSLQPGDFVDQLLARLAVATLLEEEVPTNMLGCSVDMANEAIRSLSDEGCRRRIEGVVRELTIRGQAVIVGHSSQAILQDRKGILKVLVRGSLEQRAQRVSSYQGMSIEEASAVLRHADHLRATFFQESYGIDWLDSALYDVILSTDEIEIETAAEFIASAAAKVNAATLRAETSTVGTPEEAGNAATLVAA
jgi:cytidylate kinase